MTCVQEGDLYLIELTSQLGTKETGTVSNVPGKLKKWTTGQYSDWYNGQNGQVYLEKTGR
jgi:hypothetical protein